MLDCSVVSPHAVLVRSVATLMLLWNLASFARPTRLIADGTDDEVSRRLAGESWVAKTRLRRMAIGVTRSGTSIPCWIDEAEVANEPNRVCVWLVGGLDGSNESVDAAVKLLHWVHESNEALRVRDRMSVSAVMIANPDGWAKGTGLKNASDGEPSRGYPPSDDAYRTPTNPEAQYLWRWLKAQAPQVVIEFGKEDRRQSADGGDEPQETDSLIYQLAKRTSRDEVPIHAVKLLANDEGFRAGRAQLLKLEKRAAGGVIEAAARQELLARVSRSPVEVAQRLSQRYGRSLKTVQYIPALAIVGRVRLAELTGDESHQAAAVELVAPFVMGQQKALTDKPNGSDIAGHLLFGELAVKKRDEQLVTLMRAAADLAFDADGNPRESAPFHNEMSDAVFMSCPQLALTGHLTGESKYHDMAAKHLAFMKRLCLRADGLYRHSPLDEAAWGRGNGFPALGLAWTLAYFPEQHPARREVTDSLQRHLTALRPHQDVTGMWHQVIDHPGSYREFTATCMISWAMCRGIRFGWLDREVFEPHIRRAWLAILNRIGDDGTLTDVCEGTGKQKDLRAYFDRKAILGPDDRGGAMALMFATELELFDRWAKRKAERSQ